MRYLVWAILVLVAACGPSNTNDVEQSVTMEMRTAEQVPGPGLTPMIVPGSDETVYVSDTVLLTNAGVASAAVREDEYAGGSNITVTLTPDAATMFHVATERHLQRPLAILIDGELVCAPVVQSPISDTIEIVGNFTTSEAKRIARGIVGS